MGVEIEMLEGIKCFLTGWECVGTPTDLKTYVHPNIIKVLKRRSDENFHHLTKRNYGESIKGYTVCVNGSTYTYKALVSSSIWIDNHSHGGYIGGSMLIYRKKRKV